MEDERPSDRFGGGGDGAGGAGAGDRGRPRHHIPQQDPGELLHSGIYSRSFKHRMSQNKIVMHTGQKQRFDMPKMVVFPSF